MRILFIGFVQRATIKTGNAIFQCWGKLEVVIYGKTNFFFCLLGLKGGSILELYYYLKKSIQLGFGSIDINFVM